MTRPHAAPSPEEIKEKHDLEEALEEGLEFEHRLTVEAFGTEDRVEGLRAFAEKRKPDFKGR